MKLQIDTMISRIIFEESEAYLIPHVHHIMHERLGVRQDGYFFSPAYKSGRWDGIIDFYNKEDNSFHTGLAPQVENALGELQGQFGFPYALEDIRPTPFIEPEDLPDTIQLYGDEGGIPITLRDYQYDAVVQGIEHQVGIVEVATNGGKCLSPDTKVFTSNGIEEIGDLFLNNGLELSAEEATIENTFGIQLVNRYGELETPSHLTRNGLRDVKTFVTDKGVEETVTLNHPILTVAPSGKHEWKQMKDLQIGDWVVLRRGTNVYGNSDVAVEDAQALGALIADGYFGIETQVTFTNNEKPLLDLVSSFFEREQLSVKLAPNTTSRNSFILRGIGVRKADFYGKYALLNGLAKDKEVPKKILSASREAQLAFLSGYLECEMSIEVPKCAIEVTSASKKLLEQVQLMLLNMGYVSNLAEKKVKGYEDNWYGRLTMGAIETARLLEELTFITDQRNKQKEKFFTAFASRTRNPKGQTAPFGKELVRIYKDTYPNPPQGMKKAFDFPKTISTDRLRELFHTYPGGEATIAGIMETLLDPSYLYSQVVSIEDAGCIPTYDVHMPETHSFIANGVINHNTEIASAFMQQLQPYLERGERIAFFTNNSSIFTQSIERIEQRLGVKVGRYGAGKRDFQQITFVMIPTVNASLTADPEKGLKLTGKDIIIKKMAKDIGPKLAIGTNQRSILRNIIKNYPKRTKADEKMIMELEDVLYTCGSDNEIKLKIQGYQVDYQKLIEKKNKKVYDKYNEAVEFLESVTVMIVDEAHHTSADTWFHTLTRCRNAQYRFALTGSVDRRDAMLWQRIQAIFHKPIIKITNEELIEAGHSAKPKITMFPILSPQGYEEADYMPARDVCIVNNAYRNEVITQLTTKYYREGKGILILVNIVEHGDILKASLDQLGVPNAFIHGELSLDYRDEQLSRMREGSLKVMIATTIADEGLDISGIDMLILGAGGKSLRQSLQRIGRALRKKKKGENVATIIDFIDYTNKHLLKHSKERKSTYDKEKFEVTEIQV